MNRRRILNAILLSLGALSASLEVPRVAHTSLGAAAVELTDAPAAITAATARLASNRAASHPGFDTNIYPGDSAMDAWKRSGEYEWVGYYLGGACHKDDSWSGKREHLTQGGWGLAVVYVGQQTWGKSLTPASNKKAVSAKRRPTAKSQSKKSNLRSTSSRHVARRMTRRSSAPVAGANSSCSSSLVSAGQGRRDAADAIAKTTAEGFAPGTVIFLDIERMETIPQSMHEYYTAWTQAVLDNGLYRPGVYAHTHNAESIYSDVKDVFENAGIASDPSFWIAGSGDFDVDKPPTDVGHAFADVWQGLLDVVRTHNGVKLPIDISVASVASPSTQ